MDLDSLLSSDVGIEPGQFLEQKYLGLLFGLRHINSRAEELLYDEVDLERPHLRAHVRLDRDRAQLSLDLAGRSLHRRGYRTETGPAPLKENLAAGLIRLSGWDGQSPLVDPCCGSGVLLIEAALMALQKAPGLHRPFALEGWADFRPELWEQEQNRAQKRRRGDLNLPPLIGFEEDPLIADQARANVEAAGLKGVINISNGSFTQQQLPEGPGVLVCNPPYGQRIGDEQELDALYGALGQFVRQEASGWQLWLLSGNPKLTGALRLKASRRIPVSNGGIDCRWLQYEIR